MVPIVFMKRHNFLSPNLFAELGKDRKEVEQTNCVMVFKVLQLTNIIIYRKSIWEFAA